MYSIITATQLSGNSPKLGFGDDDDDWDEIENKIPINLDSAQFNNLGLFFFCCFKLCIYVEWMEGMRNSLV